MDDEKLDVGVLGFFARPGDAETAILRRVLSGAVAGRRDRQAVRRILSGKQVDWRAEGNTRDSVTRE